MLHAIVADHGYARVPGASQWIEFAKNELDLPVGMWIYPILGFIQSNAANEAKAKEDVARALGVLNSYLLEHTFLAGEGITAADVVVSCSLLNAFKLVFVRHARSTHIASMPRAHAPWACPRHMHTIHAKHASPHTYRTCQASTTRAPHTFHAISSACFASI